MYRILFLSLVLVLTASPVFSQDVLLAAGKVLSVESMDEIDTDSMEVGNDMNFKLTTDVAGTSGSITKGSELYGRIVEIKLVDSGGSNSSFVVMFDFIKVGEEFYTMTATVTATVPDSTDISFTESEVYEGGTLISKKGAGIKIKKGTEFRVKLSKDVTTN